MGAREAEAALQEELGIPYRFICRREEEDSSLELDDVDYFCEPRCAEAPSWWIGTNSDEITDTQQTAP